MTDNSVNMFCYQCQEAAENQACIIKGICGKTSDTAALQDLLVYALRGLSSLGERIGEGDPRREDIGRLIVRGLFITVTNSNFDDDAIADCIEESFRARDRLRGPLAPGQGEDALGGLHESATWSGTRSEYPAKGAAIGVTDTENEDIRSLRELLTYGLKGIAAYAWHARALGREGREIYDFLIEGLAATTKELTRAQLIGMVLRAGEVAVITMALLDEAHTSAYGSPEVTEVGTGVRSNPGILVSGHDLEDLHELLEQSAGSGVDIYTHCEMLPAHAYPAFKKYGHLVGNYGGPWYEQRQEFESFGGPILMTTNCIVPVKKSYRDRFYTTGMAGYPGAKYIHEGEDGGPKDFSGIIRQAKSCKAPIELSSHKLVVGFAHHQILALADKVIDAVKSGAIRRFVVMAGCDGRNHERKYFTEVAEALPQDTVILTAGCAKYRYNQLELGDIGGIPRILDAGQCNDAYSLAVVALKLKEIFGVDDINQLPISFDIAWYEQKAIAVLLALLHLGIKGIRLGPTLPAFLTPGVTRVLVENFDIKPIGEVKADIDAMMRGA
uniref:Hydroxylamine reductase n=1 Tax=Candidatus Kentrum sp. SD TaxID=2126332 RepID=A0A451BKJ4_9GAMM|nr:MAG: hydroxylamine reductase [Candidatus Kentron sp. SD]